MTDSNAWVPVDVNITVPNAARVYDYALGGVHNFEADRQLWDQMERIAPESRSIARVNRQFLIRVVRWLAEERGVTQFLDIGSGIPTLGNVHEAAQEVNPQARVVYVDKDPIAVQQSVSLLSGNENALAIEGDLLKPEGILFDPRVLEFLDFSRPVAVLIVAVLHFVPEEADPRSVLSRIAAALSRDSVLAVSHVGPDATAEGRDRQEIIQKLYEQTPTPLVIRDAERIGALLDDSFELIDPGVVPAGDWRPDPEEDDDLPPQSVVLAAVARRN